VTSQGTPNAAAPQLLEAFGVGFDTAAQVLVTAGDTDVASAARLPSPRSAAPARYLLVRQDSRGDFLTHCAILWLDPLGSAVRSMI
jgi:hypothetical protein